MIVYDQTHTMDGLYKGNLYMNIMDIDYLLSTYGEDYLLTILSPDFVKALQSELEKRKNDHSLSSYYPIFSFWIDYGNDKDERLLTILEKEIKMGNMFTKSDLIHFDKNALKGMLEGFDLSIEGLAKLSPIKLYRVRTFSMCLHMAEISANSSLNVKQKRDALSSLGFSDYIIESERFTGIEREEGKGIKLTFIDHQNE